MDTSLLAKAVNRLEEVVMSVTGLTASQVETVPRQSLVESSLRKLEMYTDEENSKLDEDLEARARLAIGELDIYVPL